MIALLKVHRDEEAIVMTKNIRVKKKIQENNALDGSSHGISTQAVEYKDYSN
jgi:hypothetical protein